MTLNITKKLLEIENDKINNDLNLERKLVKLYK